MAEDLDHRLEPRERDVDKGTLIIETALKDDRVKVGIPPQLVSEALMRDDYACEQRSAGGLSVELIDDTVDQSGDVGEEAAIMTEERTECLGHSEDELSMGKFEKDLLGQMLREQDRPLPAAGWTQVETLAREWPEVIMTRMHGRASGDSR